MEQQRSIEVAPVMTDVYAKFVRINQKHALPTNVASWFARVILLLERGAEDFDVEDDLTGFTLREIIQTSLDGFWRWVTELTDPGNFDNGPLKDYQDLAAVCPEISESTEVCEDFKPLYQVVLAVSNKYILPGDAQFYCDRFFALLESGARGFDATDEQSGHNLQFLLENLLNSFWAWGTNPKNGLDYEKVLSDWQAIKTAYTSLE